MKSFFSFMVFAASTVAVASNPMANGKDIKNTKCGRVVEEDFKKTRGSKPFVTILKTPGGIRYFVIPPGPCSCPSSEDQVVAVKDLDDLFAQQSAQFREQQNVKCSPYAGCTPGWKTIFTECPVPRS